MSSSNLLISKLNELFQLDHADLDFGIYKIMNVKSEEIQKYINKTLKDKIENILNSLENDSATELTKELNTKIKQYESDGISLDLVPKIAELKEKISNIYSTKENLENSIYSNLYTFFSRYYDEGDFISQRRFKGDTYAIPYAGQETMFYWANKDQHYTKSAERFNNYSFDLSGDKRVKFRLIQAEISKDNIKDGGKNRKFSLVSPHTKNMIDDEGEQYETEYSPINFISDKEVVFNFEFKDFPKGVTQKELIDEAYSVIFNNKTIQKEWPTLFELKPTDTDLDRTLLKQHLSIYTTKNTSDYFIHQNLGLFLKRELDLYIKTEVLNLDSLNVKTVIQDLKNDFLIIKAMKEIGHDLIDLLHQLEEFQRKLWLKKKFVAAADYCITLDRIPENLYEEILSSELQWEQWKELNFISNDDKSIETLVSNPYLMIDTALLKVDLKEKIINSIDNLEEKINGTLIHSDNFQALNLIEPKYAGKVKCIYIDPPYNTDSTPIIYKNGYKHSSWASLMKERLELSMRFLKDDGLKAIAIDDTELTNLTMILEEIAPNHRLSKVTVVHNPKGSITKDFNRTHEYTLFLTKEDEKNVIARTLEENKNWRKMRRWGENSLRTERKQSFYPIYIKNESITRIGQIPSDDFHPHSKNIELENGEIEIWPIDQNGIERRWNFGLESIRQNISRIGIKKVNEEWDLFLTHELTVPKTVWTGGEYDAGLYGNTLLINILGEKIFDFPKSLNLVKKCIKLATDTGEPEIVLDYFGGSGTTGHAVVDLNREDNGSRKYILVEQGEYFDTVTKPRIQKVVFSPNWKDGVPVNKEAGVSHCFKVLRLESYEDTLNNLKVEKDENQLKLLDSLDESFKQDYVKHYMLDVESEKSLLSYDALKNPFDFYLNITADAAGSYKEKRIDVIETFNFLIGLDVDKYYSDLKNRIVIIKGKTRNNESTVIIWRDVENLPYEMLEDYIMKHELFYSEARVDVLYINGDHQLPVALSKNENIKRFFKNVKIKQIESDFFDMMFSHKEVIK